MCGADADQFDIASIANALDIELGNISNSVRMLWAKSGDGQEWLSLPQHMADSACVATALWSGWVSEQLKAALEDLTGLDSATIGQLYIFLAGAHDIGKASRSFQGQLAFRVEHAHLVDAVEDAGFEVIRMASSQDRNQWIPHSVMSEVILLEWFRGVTSLNGIDAMSLAHVVGAHHGVPAGGSYVRSAEDELEWEQSELWGDAQQELMSAIARATQIHRVFELLNRRPVRIGVEAVQLPTGLVIMADWIASNTYAFPFRVRGNQLERVKNGLESIDLTGPWQHSQLPAGVDDYFRAAFGWPSGWGARPIQAAALAAAQNAVSEKSPGLFIIEAPTGIGKTEAGLALAEQVGRATGAQGIYLAAPTMATSNGLFDRTVAWAENSTEQDQITSMYLAHSKNALNSDFGRLAIRNVGDEGAQGNVIASQWLQGPKRGLLANFAVGTIDQLLMLALQMRHSMLRHVGFAGKVIIVDEVHSYDAYMSSYLHVVLQWLARYGVSVILMSATLTPQRRAELINAYANGQPANSVELQLEEINSNTSYPLITALTRQGLQTYDCDLPNPEFTVPIEFIDDDVDTLVCVLQTELNCGGVALVVCNTVKRAQDVFDAVQIEFPGEAELHHSAFIAVDRSEKEEELRDKLGPRAHRGAGRPDRLIVVSTQVAEQSLDIDADMLISDICPMDSFIQRAGRIARHSRPSSDRPGNLQQPKFYIRGILEREPVLSFDKGITAVYDEAVLLATLLCFPEVYTRPQDNAQLVREAYQLVECGDPQDPDIPVEWSSAWSLAINEHHEERQKADLKAKQFRIPGTGVSTYSSLFYILIDDKSEEAGAAKVRDTEPTIEVMVYEDSDLGIRPWGREDLPFISPDEDPQRSVAHAFLAHTLRLPIKMTKSDDSFERVITDCERQTPLGWIRNIWLRGRVAVALDSEGNGQLGGFDLSYSRQLGLKVEKQ